MSARFLTFVLTIAVLVPTASPALAQDCEAPPGSAAVDQYCEAIPEGSGSQSGNDFQRNAAGASAGGNDGGSPLPPATARDLRAAGATGAAVEQLARASRGEAASGGGASGPAGEGTGDVAGVSASRDDVSGSPLKAIPASVENGPVAGPVLSWTLLGATVAILGLAWVGYRRRGDDVSSPPGSGEPPRA